MTAIQKTCDLIERTLGKSAAFRKVEDRLYVVKQGSAYVMISVIPGKKEADKPLVRVYAQVVSGVRPEASLFKQLLTLNAKMRFGAFAYIPEGMLVMFVHSMLGGDHMDEKELHATVTDIALIADAYDDRIVARYGGQRMQDVVEESAMKHILGVEDDHGNVVFDDGKEGKSS
ncbi:MAG: hypothetical protein EXR72_11945 [Myxococcales bacterium]|nr:hypothetical protein [Myxococcales bacterium]